MTTQFGDTSSFHLLVIGDVMLDRYIYGDVYRKSPEANVPVHLETEIVNILGGSANVMANLLSLGAKATLIGVVGEDDSGKIIQDKVEELNPGNYHLISINRPTTVKTRVTTNDQQLIRLDREETAPISRILSNRIFSIVNDTVQKERIDGIILQDYDKGIFDKDLINCIIGLANEKGIPTFIDPKNRNYWFYENSTFFKPNKNELLTSVEEGIGFESALTLTYEKLNCQHIVCTLASEGMVHYNNGKMIFSRAHNVKDPDVSGAGDSTIATMSLAYLLKYSIEEVLKWGNIAGKIVCQKKGVSTVSKYELINERFNFNNQNC